MSKYNLSTIKESDSSKTHPFNTVRLNLPLDNNGLTIIHRAAINGCLERLRVLIDSKFFNLDQLDFSGRTALHYASAMSYTKEVQMLLAYGANPNAEDICGYTPMHCAAEVGSLDVIKELIENKGEIHHQSKGGIIPLHLAASNGHTKTEKLLLDGGARTNQVDSSGANALHFASLMGYLTIVETLVARNAAINHPTLNGKSNFDEIEELLLGHGAVLGREGIPDATDPVHEPVPDIGILNHNAHDSDTLITGDIYSNYHPT